MNRSVVQFLLVLALAGRTNAQYIAPTHIWDNWHFGHHASISFATDPPTAQPGCQITGNEGCASISDMNGQLLFYMDGCTIWNRFNQVMPTGSFVGSTMCVTINQSSLIVPKPGLPRHYYVFSAAFQNYNDSTLFELWSEVDMALDGGNGDVIASTKNTPLYPYHSEQQCAVPHANGTDIWLLLHEGGECKYLAFLITEDGISTEPVISTITTDTTIVGGLMGPMAASVQGDRIATITDCYHPLRFETCAFDRSTGVVSLERTYSQGTNPGSTTCHSLCFSPDGHFLYAGIVSSTNELVQFDALSASDADFLASRTSIAEGRFWGLALGPDERIYAAQDIWDSAIAVIHEPNETGTACMFEANALPLAGGVSDVGLPNLFYRPAPVEGLADNPASTQALKVIPQPMVDEAYITLSEPLPDASELRGFDLTGRAVHVQCIVHADRLVLHRGSLLSGVYVLQVLVNGQALGTTMLTVR